MRFTRDDQGYTRGGLDVVTAINLFFKGILLFPIFLLAGYIGVIMMKHMIFQGIPAMNRPTAEQTERLQEADSQIGSESQREPETEPLTNPEVTEGPVYDRRDWVECIQSGNPSCGHLHPGSSQGFTTYYDGAD